MRSSLLFDYQEPFDLSWLELGSSPWAYCSLVLSIFGNQSPEPASQPDHHENHMVWVDSNPDVPRELPLATAQKVQPPLLTALRTIWSVWTHSRLSPLPFMQFVLLSAPQDFVCRMVLDYCTLCASNVYCIIIVSFCNNYSFILFFNESILHCLIPFGKLFHHQLLFDYCLIIDYYSDIGNVFQLFWSPKQQQHSKAINIIHHRICAWFHLSIG